MESEWINREKKKLISLISKYEQKECVNRKQVNHYDKRIRKAKNRLLKLEELCQLEHSKFHSKVDNKGTLQIRNRSLPDPPLHFILVFGFFSECSNLY